MNTDIITLEVGSKKYEVSKNELSLMSDYFRIMFTQDFSEKKKSCIKLQNISITAWEYIFKFLKKKDLIIDPSNSDLVCEMLDLLQTVNMLGFTKLEELCCDIIFKRIDLLNCLQVLEIASRVDSEKLIHKARAIALWNFDDVSKTDSFYNLNVDQVEGYCSDPALHCWTGEWGVWEAIDRWINFISESSIDRHGYVSRLIFCLCLQSLTLSDLRCMIHYDSVKKCALVVQSIQKVIKERNPDFDFKSYVSTKKIKSGEEIIVDPEEINVFIERWLQTKPRKLPSAPCIVGNVFTAPETTSPYILKFSETENKFIPLTRLRQMESRAGTMVGFKVLSDGVKIYLVGGLIMNRQSLWNNAVWTYDPLNNIWSFFSSMLRPSRNMSVCLLGNDLYLMGGFGRHRVILDQVSKLSLLDQVWTDCASMPQALYSAPCVVFQNSIYLIDTNVYCYIPKKDIWLTMPLESQVKRFSCAMADDTYIYVAGSCTKVIYKFDPTLSKLELDFVGNFKYECAQACLIDGYVYSLSQDDCTDDIFCEKMNVKTGEVTILFEGKTNSVISDLDPRHHHGCFSFFDY